jgi:hypothetical protein
MNSTRRLLITQKGQVNLAPFRSNLDQCFEVALLRNLDRHFGVCESLPLRLERTDLDGNRPLLI